MKNKKTYMIKIPSNLHQKVKMEAAKQEKNLYEVDCALLVKYVDHFYEKFRNDEEFNFDNNYESEDDKRLVKLVRIWIDEDTHKKIRMIGSYLNKSLIRTAECILEFAINKELS